MFQGRVDPTTHPFENFLYICEKYDTGLKKFVNDVVLFESRDDLTGLKSGIDPQPHKSIGVPDRARLDDLADANVDI